MVLVPTERGTVGTVQLTKLRVPLCSAMPLPPRSFTQVTRAILRSSLAVPAILTVSPMALYVPEVVGSRIERVGARLSHRASASSRATAFGSTGSLALPPHAAMARQAAAMAVNLTLRLVVRFMIRVIDADASWTGPPSMRFTGGAAHRVRVCTKCRVALGAPRKRTCCLVTVPAPAACTPQA